MCLYLARREATYYFRRIIPIELRPAFNGSSEFMFSLHTKDRAEAKRRRSAEAFRTDLELDEARAFLLASETERDTGACASRVDERRGPRRLSLSQSEPMLDLQERVQRRLNLPLLPSGADGIDAPMLDTTILQAWAAERKPRPKTVDSFRHTIESLYLRAGRKTAANYTKQDIITYKTALVQAGFSSSNIKMYLSRLRTLFKYAVENNFISTNPAAGVTIAVSEKIKRKPFSLDMLNTIFSTKIYTENERPVRGRGETALWLPILALYTGARMEELGQLRIIDVVDMTYADDNGVLQSWTFLSITRDPVDGLRIKNDGSERLVPVHPDVIGLGFLKYVQDTREQGHDRVFPELRPGAYGRRTAKWGDWWSYHLRNVCMISDRRRVFHSFRHNFKDAARHVGMPEPVQRQLMGHSGDDVADEYGEGHSLHVLVEAMKQYRVPGLKIAARREREDSSAGTAQVCARAEGSQIYRY